MKNQNIWTQVVGATSYEWSSHQRPAGTPIDDLITNRSAHTPETAPVQVTQSRQPDQWVIDQSGQRIPMWLPDEGVKPRLKSKISNAQIANLIVLALSVFFGIQVSPEMQQLIAAAAAVFLGGSSVLTIIWRWFFTDKKLS